MYNDKQEERDKDYAKFSEDRGTIPPDEWFDGYYCFQSIPLREDSLCWDWNFILIQRDRIIYELKGG